VFFLETACSQPRHNTHLNGAESERGRGLVGGQEEQKESYEDVEQTEEGKESDGEWVEESACGSVMVSVGAEMVSGAGSGYT
jgi:hypothetical protein